MVSRLRSSRREKRQRTRSGSRVRCRVESKDTAGEKESRSRRIDHGQEKAPPQKALPHVHQEREVFQARALLSVQDGSSLGQAQKAQQEVARLDERAGSRDVCRSGIGSSVVWRAASKPRDLAVPGLWLVWGGSSLDLSTPNRRDLEERSSVENRLRFARGSSKRSELLRATAWTISSPGRASWGAPGRKCRAGPQRHLCSTPATCRSPRPATA